MPLPPPRRRTLIDGYNALFCLNWMPVVALPPGSGVLRACRKRLVDLTERYAPHPRLVTIIFDGREMPGLPRPEHGKRGVQVVFSVGVADDLLEDYVRRDPNPRDLTVVSDDNRVRLAGRRRSSQVLGVAEWYEGLENPHAGNARRLDDQESEARDLRADLYPGEIAILRAELGSMEVRLEKGGPTPVVGIHLIEQLKRMLGGEILPEPRLKQPLCRKPPPL